MKKQIIYQVLPRLWKNGKFSDWQKASFDYVKSLSADYIWYTGIIRHSSGKEWVKGNPGCPYSISDYYDVNPYLADNPDNRMQEFDALVSRTHKAGLKLIIDFVPNHVSRDGASGIPTCGYCDYDWTETLKIDYTHPDTWTTLLDILEFWASKGVDGFRCDMIEMVPSDFLAWAIGKVKSAHPGVIFIGEAYGRHNYPLYLQEVGFDLIYDKSGYYDSVRSIQKGMTVEALTWNWQSLGSLQDGMLNFLENHDEQRCASPAFAGSADRCYAALAVGTLFNNASFMLYAGQECGEQALQNADYRTSIFNMDKVDSLESPDAAVLEKYRQTLKLASSPLFSEGGNWDLCYCNSESEGFNPSAHFAFLRILEGKAILVACNFSNYDCTMNVCIPKETGLASGLFKLDVPAWDYVTIQVFS